MKRPEPPDLASLSASQVQSVSAICNDFEDHWGHADRPTVQEYLRRAGDDAGPVVRLVLLRELLTSELELGAQDAKARDIEAYRSLFSGPGENDVVDYVLGEETKADAERRFHVVKRHAQGGLGEVFIAHDRHVDRDVALKKIKPELAEDESSRNRFMREAEITGQLEHPNIAPVYSMGLDGDKLPFYAMRFIEGQPLNEAISEFEKTRTLGSKQGERLLALRKLLGRFNAVCDAVAFAHSRGILHRDIKPANVILGRFGETILADWGLAKKIGASESDSFAGPAVDWEHDGARMTEHGSVLGTLPYMSPEQAQSATGPLSAATDIYSLGATLYHLLTGRPPFVGNVYEELRRKVIQGDFRSPRQVDPGVPPALESIVLKAMARDPGDRYATATALAEDIEHWLADEPVSAWREPLLARTGRGIRRHRTLVFSTAAALCVGMIGLAGFIVALTGKNRELDDQRRQAVDQRNRAEQARDLAFKAVQAIVVTDTDAMRTEEARPYRSMLLDEGLRLSQEMIQGAEGDGRADRLRARALMMEAKILVEKGDPARAYEAGKAAVDLLDQLVARDPLDIDNRDELAQLLHQLGSMGPSAETNRANSTRSNQIYMALLEEHPDARQATDWSGAIAFNLRNIGNDYIHERRSTSGPQKTSLLDSAINTFHQGWAFCDEQVQGGNRSDKVVRSHALNATYLCRAYRARAATRENPDERSGDFRAAFEWGKKGIDGSQLLFDGNRDNFLFGWELHEAQREVGLNFYDQENWAEAIAYFTKVRETTGLMAERVGLPISRVVELQESVAIDDFNILSSLAQIPGADEKRKMELLDEMDAVCEKLDVVRPLSRTLRVIYAHVALAKADGIGESTGVPDVEFNAKAARLYGFLLDEDPNDSQWRRNMFLAQLELADALAAHGRNDESKTAEAAALASAKKYPSLLVQVAQDYAGGSQLIKNGPNKLDPATREKVCQRYVGHVVPLLRAAVAAGFKDVKKIRNERAFAPFLSDPEFQAILYGLEFPRNPIPRS
jgi:tRNA A-37 threonylcarbamoyl transferase component Bud32